MDETQRYTDIDMPFYASEIAPVLPPTVLDFHTHTWVGREIEDVPGARYMVTLDDYPVERLIEDSRRIFPGCEYQAVCFGDPTPSADIHQTNSYAAAAGGNPGLYPLRVTKRGGASCSELEQDLRDQGFFGYKVLLNWQGDDYGAVTIEDMIGPDEMAVANDHKLVVLLHVPRSGRLADPEIQRGVRWLSQSYPDSSIVLAHCGRAYLPDEMAKSIDSIRDLENVYLDTAMVMDATVLQIVFENIDSRRVLYATDFPVAAMRGRRVYVMDHWVDVVLEGYPTSAYRVAGNNIRASFMAYEIVLAIRRAGERAGLSSVQVHDVFYKNGMRLLKRAMVGRQMELARDKWGRNK
jgi:hypothetical protein